MATQTSYTTIKVARFGFSVLNVTLNRVETNNVREMAASMIVAACQANQSGDDLLYVLDEWAKALGNADGFTSFHMEADGDYTNDYQCSIRHFDVTDEQRRNALHNNREVEHMFF